MKLQTLKKDYDIKLNSTIVKVDAPKYIYVPLEKSIKLDKSLSVKKEQQISNDWISPVSGSVVGNKYCMLPNGKMVKCMSILNDYKEKYSKRVASLKTLSKVSLEKIKNDLKEFGCSKLAEKIDCAQKSSILLLNSIEDEPYVANEVFISKEYTSDILEMLDILREKLEINEAKILVSSRDRDNIETFENTIGTYTHLTLSFLPDYYLLGKDEFLVKYLHLKEEILILKPSEVKVIFNIVKHHHYDINKVFTVSGDGIENPTIFEAKIGSSIQTILKNHIRFKKDIDTVTYVNGLLNGKDIDPTNLIVTKDLNSILIMKKDLPKEEECINCGKCVSICPVGCNPKKTYNTKKKKYVKDCIDCGLCSYICPSFINLRRVIKGDEHE